MKQIAIAIDQLINTFIWAKGEGFGMADETISARAFRLSESSTAWLIATSLINTIFFWQINHCKSAYDNEFARKHMPSHYRAP